jgi:YD repeat-containing protein
MTNDRLERTDTGWRYTTGNHDTELYGSDGRLLSIITRSGRTTNLTYNDAGHLTEVSDDAGRTLSFAYDSDSRIITMTAPDGGIYSYEYDGLNLVKVTYPDDTPNDQSDNPSKSYHYENGLYALTGITDENGNRYATWDYSNGRAILSEHADGADRTTFSYNADGTTTVTNALGKQTTYHFVDIKGYRYISSVEGHPSQYCAGANKAYSYDANGNVLSKTDWNGVSTTYSYDTERNLELTRTEAAGTPEERTITTEWHSEFRLPTRITEPGKVTEYSYDAQGRQLSRTVRNP